jgi:uncharacterized protein
VARGDRVAPRRGDRREEAVADNVDVVKSAYEAFDEGDLDKVLEDFADDAVWQGSNSTELPGGGEHSGKDEISEVLKSIVGAWDEYELKLDRFIEDDDTVVVLGRNEVTKDGDTTEIPVVHVIEFEDGEVKLFRALTDTLLMAEALGLIAGKPPSEQEDDDSGDDSGDDDGDDDEKDDEKDDDGEKDEKDDDDKGDDDGEKDDDDEDEKDDDKS